MNKKDSYEGLKSLEEVDHKHDPKKSLDNYWVHNNTKKGKQKNYTKYKKDIQRYRNPKTTIHVRK